MGQNKSTTDKTCEFSVIIYVIIPKIFLNICMGETPNLFAVLSANKIIFNFLYVSHIGHKQFETIERNEDSKQHKIEKKKISVW